jgi:FKBP-type peptidyl-prolyl cis-trans isomerase FkpA
MIRILLLLACVPAFASDLETEKKLSAEYLARMAQEPGAQVLEQGVVIRPIFNSGGTVFPKITDQVQVSYHLVDRESRVLDESVTSDELAVFPLSRLITCWQIALPKIPVGSFYKVSCPSSTAYGDGGAGDGAIKGGAALTFRLTLYGVK